MKLFPVPSLKINIPLIFLILTAAFIKLIYLNSYADLPDWNFLTVDNYFHHNWATVMSDGDILGSSTYFRAPGYIFFLAIIYSLVGSSIVAARIAGLLVGLASILMTYKLTERVLDKRVALVAGFIQTFYPIFIYFDGELLLDPLSVLLTQVSLYYLVRTIQDENSGYLALSGFFTGLAAITRPTALLLIPITIITILFLKEKFPHWMRALPLYLFSAAIVIGPISARNFILADDPVMISSQGGINFYMGNNEDADGFSATMPEPLGANWRIEDINHIAMEESGRQLKPSEVSSYWYQQGIDWITSNPIHFVNLYFKKLSLFLVNNELSNNRSIGAFSKKVPLLNLNPISFGLILPFALIGFALGFKKRPELRPVIGYVLLYILALSFFFVNARFRLPILPFMITGTAIGIRSIPSLLSKNRLLNIVTISLLISVSLFSFFMPVGVKKIKGVSHFVAAGLHNYNNADYQEALRYFQKAKLQNADAPDINLNIGACFLRMGQLDSAGSYFTHETIIHPGRAEAFTDLASLALLEGDTKAAIAWSYSSLARKPYSTNAARNLVRALTVDSSISSDSLIKIYRSIRADIGPNLIVLNEILLSLNSKGLTDEAERLAFQNILIKPTPVEVDDFAFGSRFVQSRENFKHSIAVANHILGYINAQKGDFSQALNHARRAVAIDSTFSDAWVNLVSAHISLGQFNTADSILNISIRKFPDNLSLQRIIELSK